MESGVAKVTLVVSAGGPGMGFVERLGVTLWQIGA
jgi:hypothetical protein